MKRFIILFTFALFLLFSFSFTNASHLMGNDVENPLITDSEYAPLATNDNDDDANNLPVAENRAWTVPRGQFDVGIPIYGTIFGFMTSMNHDNPISLMIRAIYIMSFIVCVQVYFGFYISVQKRGGANCMTSCLPEFKYNRVDFGNNGMTVSFGRWISGPFSWITQIISLLPAEAYVYLEKEAYFPDRSIVSLIFMVQLLYYFGLFDCYRSNILANNN